MGQPKKEVNFEVLDALLQFKVSAEFCADHLGVSRDTIFRRVKEQFGITFGEYHKLKIEGTATKLQQKAIKMALEGNNTMMIFCLKNLAGWADKQEVAHNISKIDIETQDAEL